MIRKLLFTILLCFQISAFAQIKPPAGATDKDIYYDSQNNAWAVYTTSVKVYPYTDNTDWNYERYQIQIRKRENNKWVYINTYSVNYKIEKALGEEMYGYVSGGLLKVFFDDYDNLLFHFDFSYTVFETGVRFKSLYGYINNKIYLIEDNTHQTTQYSFGNEYHWHYDIKYYLKEGHLYYNRDYNSLYDCVNNDCSIVAVEVLPYYKLVTMATPIISNGKEVLLVFKNGKFEIEGKEEVTLIIHDLQGKAIFNEAIQSGLYIVTIVNKDGSVTKVKAMAQ